MLECFVIIMKKCKGKFTNPVFCQGFCSLDGLNFLQALLLRLCGERGETGARAPALLYCTVDVLIYPDRRHSAKIAFCANLSSS